MKTRLKLTTRGKYAVMAMIEIGRSTGKRPVPLSDIAGTTNISLSYLEQLIAGLRRHGLVKSYRGPGAVTRWARRQMIFRCPTFCGGRGFYARQKKCCRKTA
ncbi:MAG: Rrf2 family transcriptional regulator [Alphaproteobacteria bacterium]|nr:Rrf2 family transcriptional regulator [Alphaproteobacteria bacterium]